MYRLPLIAALAVLMICAATAANAQLATSAEHAILVDGATGQVLWAKDADVPMPPASMSKLMTLELLFQRIQDGRVKLTDTFPVSENAWRTGGSKMFVKVGDRIPVEDLIRGVIVDSGNDACVVIAEALGGTVDGFVAMMNERAKQIGLTQSHFVNPDGLPEPPGQQMSAHDLARLARHIIYTYPKLYPYFNEHSFAWSGITQNNRDTVLAKLPGADGLKTGHTDAAGYGITTSAVQNGERLILVLNGLRYPDLDNASPPRQDWVAGQRRGDEAARILGIAFREFRRYRLFGPDDVVGEAKVWQGANDTVPLKLGAPLGVVMQVASHSGMKVTIEYQGPVPAPISKGRRIGTLHVAAPNFPGMDVPLYAAQDVPAAGFLSKIVDGFRALIFGKPK